MSCRNTRVFSLSRTTGEGWGEGCLVKLPSVSSLTLDLSQRERESTLNIRKEKEDIPCYSNPPKTPSISVSSSATSRRAWTSIKGLSAWRKLKNYRLASVRFTACAT